MQSLTPRELHQKIRSGQARITVLDVREPWETRIARLEGSVFAPLSTLGTEIVDDLPDDRDIVVLCHHGVRSAMVTQWLEQNGRERVFNLGGGIDEWSRTIDPSLPRY